MNNSPCDPPPAGPQHALTHSPRDSHLTWACRELPAAGWGLAAELRAPSSAGCRAEQGRAGQAEPAKPVPWRTDGHFKPCDLLPKSEFQAAKTSARVKKQR